MITFGPRFSSLLRPDSASRQRPAGSDPANVRKEDASTLQQLTAASKARPKYARGLDKSDHCDVDLSTDMPGWKYAFALSKDAVKAATPPGTVRVVEHKPRPPPQRDTRDDAPPPELDLARFPIPTPDPSDPLNWARWRKLSCLGTLCTYAFVCSFASASLSPALAIWNASFPSDPRGMADLSRFTALNVLLLGLGNIVFVPLANVFGRRIVLVLSALTLFIATACGTRDFGSGAEHGMGMYEGVLIIRIFQGLGSSVSETVGPAVVGDMFFVQERGGWMALYTACLASGSVIGGICGGYIATRYGWFGIFWVCAALTGVAFLAMVLLVPETLFERSPLVFANIATVIPEERHRHRHRHRTPDDISDEEKEIDGGTENHTRRSGVRQYYYQRTPTPYLSLGTLPSIRMTMPSRFITSVYTPLDINTNQPPYFRDYWDPRLGLTWYETASESDESEERSPTVHERESPMPTVLRPPPTAAQGRRRDAAVGLTPVTGGIAARQATARGPHYRLYPPPSEIDTRQIGRGGNQNRPPILRKHENNDTIGLSNRFSVVVGPFAQGHLNRGSASSSIPSSSDASTHYEPYTYLRSLRLFPRQQQQHPPESPYSPHSPRGNLHVPKPPFPIPTTTRKKSLWKHFLSPLLTLRLLPVWVATLHYSTLIGSVAVISTLGPSLLASPPYNWTVSHSGLLLFSGALVGIILGGLYASILSDERMKVAGTGTTTTTTKPSSGTGGEGQVQGQGLGSRRGRAGGGRTGGGRTEKVKSWRERFLGNNDYGYAEAENRLMVALPGLVIATGGLLVWGFCGEYGGPGLNSAAAGAAGAGGGGGGGGAGSGSGNVTAEVGVAPGLSTNLNNGNAPGGGGGGGYGVNRYSWLGLVFGFGMVSFGAAGVPGVWFNYLIDSYANLASDCFVMICILRGLIPFAWTFFVSAWVAKQGYLVVFGGGFTVILGVFSLLLIPVIWYGKRMRIATARFVVGNQ
ncbi:hypothetical protein QBC32DRAFT_245825 [Pseudoneurospora amorphoporcata]|uniref:Major facilitator superfamily (MFS) profile domain-containing protein n=1 Tax=Pseudoneurospora amorphoporcata TaxID=241081 RepID=A0AAN6SBS1_9PEZI|nr:hypothetical protein QBC32DRAFT_245825 [Pseudoneurospora amorphoporcata]